MIRLAVILSHPIQYYSPWFRKISEEPGILLKVFYLWDFGVSDKVDRSFGRVVKWDIPLLDGYEYEFVPNLSRNPGSHRFAGLHNPELVGRLTEWRPDVILMFGYNFRSHLAVLLSLRLRRIPILHRGDSHGIGRFASWRESMKDALRKVVFRRFAGFLAVGKANAAWIAGHGVPQDRIFHTPHCVDNERFSANLAAAREEGLAWRLELGISDDRIVVLFAGKFEDKKRPLLLLEAFLRVTSEAQSAGARQDRGGMSFLEEPEPVLLFVGSGSLVEEMKRRAEKASGSVFFAPFQNQRAMPRTYAAADLFALPSYGTGETWGLAINEAMNLGKPVVVSSHVGCGPDLVHPGRNGWIFPAGDQEALERVLRDALSEAARLREFGDASRIIIKNYSYAAATEGLRNALNSCVT